MRIPVFAIEANPEIDPPFIRKSPAYCEVEVGANRARWRDASDISKGIQLLTVRSGVKSEARGSREQSGSLTAYESQLNAEYFGSSTRSIGKLSQHYEVALESHILKGLKGMPRKCGVIAARVKTILSNPSHA